jgi:cytochrome c oxidase cbb3-type subunit 3
MANNQKKDELIQGHDSDGIQEFDNSLPRWWLYGFYITIIFSVIYMARYHFGSDGQVMKNEYDQEIAEAAIVQSKSPKAGPKAVKALTDAASLAAGKAIFEGTNNLCYTCHRNDLGGQVGPNLTDDYWIHGCSLEQIMKNITTGFPEKGMLPYGSNNKLSDEQLLQVASYVISMHGTNPADPKPIEPEREILCQPNATAGSTASK